MSNRLSDESSPYLLQHKDNPVDWYAWGTEALDAARLTDRPIFLSVGYSACHWCHVMEHESFEDEATAGLLNENFVSIKVDREERPDIDQIYMSAVHILTGHGGWPMSVFLTPDGKPFHGGTYFPPAPRHGLPSFKQMLEAVHEAWTVRREELVAGADRIVDGLEGDLGLDLPAAPVVETDLLLATQGLASSHDKTNGGWGGAPKFPQPMAIEFLLRRHLATGEQLLLDVADRALSKMARGGIYDHVGGGFHRYSVDGMWHVPHFEKMLYDNSQLARVYLHAWQITLNPEYRRVVEEILDWVQREMTHPAGGFFGTLDADSEGVEGRFYVWSADQLNQALGQEAELVADVFDVTERGNWEGTNVLRRLRDLDVISYTSQTDVDDIESKISWARPVLLDYRERRVRPTLDNKIITSWNGLMIAAFAEAARVFKREDYAATAEAAGAFCRRELWREDDRVWRTWKDGHPTLNAYLEDYAYLAEGLIELYQTTFNDQWFVAARGLCDVILRQFQDGEGGFYDTSHDHEKLVSRPRDVQDNATPSGGAMAVTVLGRMHALTGDANYRTVAEHALATVGPGAARYPTAFAQWLSAADFLVGQVTEVAVVGDRLGREVLLEVIRETYRPRCVVAAGMVNDGSQVPLLDERGLLDGEAAAYVCHGFECDLPTADPTRVRELLNA